MKTLFSQLMLAVCIIGTISCNRTTKESTKVEVPKKEATKQARIPVAESYTTFYKRFHSDSIFQVSRIMFPMKGHYTDTVGDLVHWNKNNWIMHRFEIQTVDTSIYKVELKDFNDYKIELLYIEGGGFKIERRFKRMKDGKWYLVFYTDDNL